MGRIIAYFKRDNNFIKLVYFILGIFISSIIYNAVFVPGKIVTGGVSGLAIIVQAITGLSTTIFIDIANVILILVSFIFLGKKKTMTQLLGCISYPLMITITAPLASQIKIDINPLLLYLIAASIYGLALGLVYRAGYSTGGFDILTEIFSNKLKKPITAISPVLNTSVIISGAIVFSPVQIMCSLIVIYISNKVTNATLFSISTSKMIYVISKNNATIEKYIMNDIHTGATEIKIHSGFFERKKQMLLCVIHNSQYKKFKNKILSIDPEAFILSNKCYEVNGGMRYTLIPF